MTRKAFAIGENSIKAGTRQTIQLPFSVLSNHVPISLPVHIIHGKKDGPTVFVSAAVHGDEIVGVEIIRRLLAVRSLAALKGTLLVIPVVNAFGFISHSRYLPDRRDLNRMFPGTENGSLASQLASLFMREVVARCDYGIDLHSAAIHRTNYPQIRADLSNPETHELASAFCAPIVMHSDVRDGSLRQAAHDAGVPVLLFEGGEALRFDNFAIRVGLRGVLSVLNHLKMIRYRAKLAEGFQTLESHSSYWVRAPRGGILRDALDIGAIVSEGTRLGVVSDPFGENEEEVLARKPGIIIGGTRLPVVNRGDALFHIARAKNGEGASELFGRMEDDLEEDSHLDDYLLHDA